MTNTVSPETGRRLAAAGFPQPSPAPGQFWYAPSGSLLFVISFDSKSFVLAQIGHNSTFKVGLDDFEVWIFAPTATDILRELGHSSMFWDERKCGFSISTVDNINLIGWTIINNTNPAEAAALTWLSIHEKK